jgi:hypothetical protein
MNVDIEWVLANLVKASRIIEHNGNPLSVDELRAVMLAAKAKGYTTIKDIPDELIDSIVKP